MKYVGTHSPTPGTLPLSGRRHPSGERLIARLRATCIDQQLADGVPPWQSATHAARALQLSNPRTRRTLARSLERLVELAEEPSTPIEVRSTVVAPCRPQVREARPIMLMMAFQLRTDRPLGTRGLARLRLLLSNGVGPCYAPSRPDALVTELQTVSALLDAVD